MSDCREVLHPPPNPFASPVHASVPATVVKPAERPIWWYELLLGVGVIWGIEIAIAFALVVVSLVVAIATGGPNPFQGPNPGANAAALQNPIVIVAATLMSNGCTLTVVWFIVCRLRKLPFAAGFALRPIGPVWIFGSVAIGVVGAGLGTLFIMAIGPTEDSFMAELGSTPMGLAAIVFLAVTVPPFEEFYYRGFLFPGLRHYIGWAPAIAVVALWFGIAHSFQLFGAWAELATVFTMGLIWTGLRQWSDSLWPPLIAHWCYNSSLVAITLVQVVVEGGI